MDKKLLDAYYEGRCNDDERKAVEEWFVAEEYDDYQVKPAGHLEHELWEGINSQIRPKSHRLYYWSAAAVVMAVFTVFALMYQRNQPVTMQFTKVETLNGQRIKAVLPDGSVVYLNANSSLRYPEKFGDIREVELAGEAFFEVVKMPDKPFVITGKTTKTRVLGTSFNLVERPGQTILTVLTGKVAYSNINTSQMIIVKPDEQGAMNGSGGLVKKTVYAKKYTAWKDGRMLFDNNTVVEIAAILENWYGVKIKITGKHLGEQSFTGQFDNPQLAEVLRTMGFALKFKYQHINNSVVLSPE